MKIFAPIVLSAFLLLSAAANDSWTDRFKHWLPSFIAEWWWPEAPDEPLATLDASLLARPEAEAFLAIPATEDVAHQFNWPLTTLQPAYSQKRWEVAREETVLLRNPYQQLPLFKGQACRLLYPVDDFPIYFSGVLRAYGPLHTIAYQERIIKELVPLVDDQVVNIIFTDRNRLTEKPNWFASLTDYPMTAPVVLVHFGASDELPSLPENWSVIIAGDRNQESESWVAQVLFGGMTLNNRTTKTIAGYPVGSGYQLNKHMVGYASPASVGFDPIALEKVDYHINRAIRKRAMPGAQLAILKDGQVVYQKSYGHHTYRREQSVYTSDLYDLASITKAAATALAVMHLYDQSAIQLDKRVKDYLPIFKKRPVGRYTIEQLLTHQTGIQADLPIAKYLGRTFVKKEAAPGYSIQIAPQRWLADEVPEGIIGKLKYVNYTKRRIYRYSDVNYILLQLIVEAISGQAMDELLSEKVYQPLGLERLQFLPAERFPANQMVPTVYDSWMRETMLTGFVHDEGAALLGGVAGHAGLFGNATELAMLFQMLLNEGHLNGQQIFTPETVKTFTTKSRFNYRALAFDRLAGGWPNVIKRGASKATFGHLGFSGTSVWADPEQNLVFVLLTNRIHPNGKNDRFIQQKIRGKVHEQVYRSLVQDVAAR